MITLREYLTSLFDRAYETKDGVKRVKNPALKNFLKEHDLIGTINGSPHWRRNKNYYNRSAK